MSNYGKPQSEAGQYSEEKLFGQVVPYLNKIYSLGVRTVFDCTTQYFGRRVDLLRKLSVATGMQIVTNTGFYGAAKDRYVPAAAFSADAQSIANGWVQEYVEGIEGTGIRPGFIKLGFDEGPPSHIDAKLFVAGILAHKKTGLKLAVHTGANLVAARLQRRLLREHDASARAWIWVHANKVSDTQVLLAAAAEGVWISLDGVAPSNLRATIERLKAFRAKALLHKVLLSHDGNAFPAGGAVRPFEAVVTELIPALLESGFTQAECDQLTIDNPRRAFAIEPLTLEGPVVHRKAVSRPAPSDIGPARY